MKQKIVRYLIMMIALITFGYASYELTLVYLENEKSYEVMQSVSELFMQPISEEEADSESVIEDAEGNNEIIKLNNTSGMSGFVWDYDLMLSYNSEAKGYIRQGDGDYIDNPILQHDDNDYYLCHLADNTYNRIGSIFIDYRINEGLEAKNCIIYGHCMGTSVKNIMFGSLVWYVEKDGYALSHPDFDIYVGDKHYKYYVFACYETEAIGSDTYQYSFSSDEKFMNYIDECIKRSKYKFTEAGDIGVDDKIVTLSTCTRFDKSKRMIVQLVRREEVE